jgi:hypothetical protein
MRKNNRNDQRRPGPTPRLRRRRRWPTCEATGKRRYRTRQDAKAEVERAWHLRASAALDERASSLRVVRAYRCPSCRGWHVTSMQFFSESQPLQALPDQARSVAEEGLAQGLAVAAQSPAQVAGALRETVSDAFLAGMSAGCLTAAAVCVAGALFVLAVLPAHPE